MLLDMTIANFKSVRLPQTISYEAVRDSRFKESKIVHINDKLNIIKTAAIIGANGSGKSSFVRALESLKSIVCSKGDEVENPLQVLSGTNFAYTSTKGEPSTISIRILVDRGIEPTAENPESRPSITADYTLVATNKMVYSETLYFIYNSSKRLMFDRKLVGVEVEVEDETSAPKYKYIFGKLYRGEKKRLVKKIDEKHVFLSASADKNSEICQSVVNWFKDDLNILPMGVSSISEKYIIDQITAHPNWVQQLTNFLWSLDITDIKKIQILKGRLVFSHANVLQSYATYYSLESLSLRRLCLIGIAFFESFITHRTIIIDDFGMLLHPDILKHIIEIFEACNDKTGSQLLAIDCNPSLLRPGLMRRDGIYFAEKNEKNETVYFSLAQFRYSRSRDLTSEQYMNGAFGSLPLLSNFYFVDSNEKEDK
ncbi:MAG: ATP-binding protein [Spirochaetaceae bacterium]|nr:ATP-binding protein [Spirochaetaceae bacterium]